MAYALAYPDHVSRLLLDSVLPPDLPDPYEANVLQHDADDAAAYCAVGCNGTALRRRRRRAREQARREAADRARCCTPNGTHDVTKTVDGHEAALDRARRRPEPRRGGRAARGHARGARSATRSLSCGSPSCTTLGNAESSIDLSAGLYAATVCRDGPFPWDAEHARRPAAGARCRPRSPPCLPARFGPFGAVGGAASATPTSASQWPGTDRRRTARRRPAPERADAGGQRRLRHAHADASARSRSSRGSRRDICSSFPASATAPSPPIRRLRGQRGALAGCSIRPCRRRARSTKPLVAPVPALPRARAGAPGTHAVCRARPTPIAKQTLQDAQALWLMTAGVSGAATVAGPLRRLAVARPPSTITLSNFSDARGVTRHRHAHALKKFGPPLVFQGAVTVGGAAAAHGVLGLHGREPPRRARRPHRGLGRAVAGAASATAHTRELADLPAEGLRQRRALDGDRDRRRQALALRCLRQLPEAARDAVRQRVRRARAGRP